MSDGGIYEHDGQELHGSGREFDERTAPAPASPHAEMAQRLRRMAAEVYHFSAAIASGMDDIADQLDAKPEQPPVTAQELRKPRQWVIEEGKR